MQPESPFSVYECRNGRVRKEHLVKVPVNIDQTKWLHLAQQGDAEAFAMLVKAYQVPVYNLCYRMLGEAGEAEDAAQETFMRAYRGLSHYDAERSFATWLLSIASHYCIDHARRRRILPLPMETLLPSQQQADAAPGPEDVLSLRERREQVSEMVRNLNPHRRAAVLLRYWYDLSYEEISQVLSLSVSAVKSQLHRARRELAQSWLELEGRQALTVRGRENEPSAV